LVPLYARDDTYTNSPDSRQLDQVRERLRTKHYSIVTVDQYIHWIKRFIPLHGKRHPKEMGGQRRSQRS
jgi:hypothetical protein